MVDVHLISYYVGIVIVFVTHIYMLFSPMSPSIMQSHAIINIFAALCIAYYFMYKEKYITF